MLILVSFGAKHTELQCNYAFSVICRTMRFRSLAVLNKIVLNKKDVFPNYTPFKFSVL